MKILEWIALAIGALLLWGWAKNNLLNQQAPVNGPSYYGSIGGESSLGLGSYNGPNGGYYNGYSPFPQQGWSDFAQMPIQFPIYIKAGSPLQPQTPTWY